MKLRSAWLWISLVLAAMVLVGCAGGDGTPARDGIFLHVSSGLDNPHRVLMALNMAVMMSEDRDVIMYFDIKGIEVVLNDAPDIAYSHFPTSHTQLAALAEKGVTVMACPGCLKAAGKTADDLASGVQVADKERFFSFTDGRIPTLDY